MQLKILDVTRQGGYFEVNYEMTLDVPTAQQSAVGGTTVVKSDRISFTNGTTVAQIKTILAGKLSSAQANLNSDTTHQYYGITFDGTNWSA